MRMARGLKFPTMDRFGFLKSTMVGRPIGQAVGSGSHIMAGLGFPTSLGAGLHITMAVGFSGAEHGHGGLARSTRHIVRFGRLHTSPSLGLAEAWASTSGLDSVQLAGFRSDPATSFLPCGAVFVRTFGS